jgi:CRISPR-associated protein Cmr5
MAADRVTEIKERDWADRYGVICHNFPIMVRTCGLCQAVAFSAAKAKSDGHRAEAHKRILADVQAITRKTPEQIAELPVEEYMLQTRRLLAAWIYYKRFAESILGAKPGEQRDE